VTRIQSNYPNPFNPRTSIRFDLERAGTMQLAIYDAAGRLVRRLASGAMSAGTHVLPWDGTDSSGNTVASGVYVARLEAAGRVATHRMVLLK
jgi:flagellar hook assembly protein FlgD